MAKASSNTNTGGGTATAEKKKRDPRPPIESAERLLKRQIGMLPQTDETQQLRDGLEGVVRLLQTVDQVVDSGAAPAIDTAWGKVVALGKGRRVMTGMFATASASVF
jgi:hypothetical protein